MTQFEAAQRFYTRHGYRPVDQSDLPEDMPTNPIDSLHYRLDL